MASVGSCNLHRYSLFGNGELNASFSDARSVRAMRVALFQEHLGADTTEVDDVEALRLFRRIARANRRRHVRNDPRWRAMAFALDAASYGLAPVLVARRERAAAGFGRVTAQCIAEDGIGPISTVATREETDSPRPSYGLAI